MARRSKAVLEGAVQGAACNNSIGDTHDERRSQDQVVPVHTYQQWSCQRRWTRIV